LAREANHREHDACDRSCNEQEQSQLHEPPTAQRSPCPRSRGPTAAVTARRGIRDTRVARIRDGPGTRPRRTRRSQPK
jgi:hypothetical protein